MDNFKVSPQHEAGQLAETLLAIKLIRPNYVKTSAYKLTNPRMFLQQNHL